MKIDYTRLPVRPEGNTPNGTVEKLKDHALALVLLSPPSVSVEIKKELMEVISIIDNALYALKTED